MGANLRRARLDQSNLRKVDLRGADLRQARLCNVDLRDADLRAANLLGADLSNADLRGADRRGAYLVGTCLHKATLTDAWLWGTLYTGWALEHVTCEGVYWDKARREKSAYRPGEFAQLFASVPRCTCQPMRHAAAPVPGMGQQASQPGRVQETWRPEHEGAWRYF